MNKNFKFQIKSFTSISFVLFLLSIPFSFAYSLDFLEKNKSYTSFSLYSVYFIDVVALFFIIVALTNLSWHKKSFLTSCGCTRLPDGQVARYVPTLAFAVFAILSFLWSGSPFLSVFSGLRMLLVVAALYIMVILVRKSKKYQNLFFKTVIAVGAIESLVALGQFISGHSVGLFFLGESYLGADVLGLAKVNLFGHEFIRAYGTLPHPNVLGGFLLFTLISTYFYQPLKHRNILLTLQMVGLGLTFSRSAILGLVIMVILNWKNLTYSVSRKLVIFILISSIFVLRSPIQRIMNGHDETINIRVEYAKAAFNRFWDSPILGRGWGTGPVELPAFSQFPFYTWEMQPVHNIYLLVLSDLGIVGLLLFGCFIYITLKPLTDQSKFALLSSRPKSRDPENALNSSWIPPGVYPVLRYGAGMTKRPWRCLFISYLFIGFFDHYLLTLPQGMFIFFASAFLVSQAPRQKTEKIPLKA